MNWERVKSFVEAESLLMIPMGALLAIRAITAPEKYNVIPFKQ
jgi:hypothetical protein